MLDAGAAGVMFPRLDTVEEVAQAMRYLRYPPDGDRGVATYNRACGFGLHPEVLSSANDSVIGVVQIESVSALIHVEQIVELPGVDVIFVGPADLSYALGVPGQLSSPEFVAALDRVVAAANGAGKVAGILGGTRELAERFYAQGAKFVAVGSDSTLLATAARAAAASLAPSSADADAGQLVSR